jgi:hydrogenase maturation protease
MTAPILIFGWGNPSRGDDALGPLFLERIEALGLPGIEYLTDFQLQVEHALDLQGRQRVLFVDASFDAAPPFTVTALEPVQDASFTSHAMSPQAVLHVFTEITDDKPPPTWLLAIRGEAFELGEPLSAAATAHLDEAVRWARSWLADG